jgi:putative addiction module component (TIGR02574 family)
MVQETRKLIDQVLALPPKDRSNIADRILSSLDHPDDNIDILWRWEIENRIEAYNLGKLKKVPLQDVLAKYQK